MICYNNSSIIFFILIILIEQCISFPQMTSKLYMHEDHSRSHDFRPPGPNDIRGPCPGLNAAANHGYIPRSGIVTFDELVHMQQELYNIDVDVAKILAALGVALDGDISTGKLSIGKNSSAVHGGGLDTHGTFEADSSLTRNDFYLANGNNYAFNATLYGMMYDVAQKNGGLYNRATMAEYRLQRYQQSLNENGKFFFPPQTLLLYAAASFLYELFPNGTDMLPTETVISSFFGAQSIGNRQWISVPEKIPRNWIKRQTPYTLIDVIKEMLELYSAHPTLFGENVGEPNTFVPGPLQLSPDQLTVKGVACFWYQSTLSAIASQIQPGITTPATAIFNFLTGIIDPIFGAQFGCTSTTMNLK